MIRRPPRSTLSSSSAASDVYKRQGPRTRHHIGVVEPTIGGASQNRIGMQRHRMLLAGGVGAVTNSRSKATLQVATKLHLEIVRRGALRCRLRGDACGQNRREL